LPSTIPAKKPLPSNNKAPGCRGQGAALLEKQIMLSVPDRGDDKVGYANALNVEVVAGTGRRVITGGVDLN